MHIKRGRDTKIPQSSGPPDKGRDTKIPQSSGPPVKVGDEAVHKELGDRMERAATTAPSLEAECQDTILWDVNPQTKFETTSKQSNDPPLSRGYTLGSGEDSMKLLELMELCTKLSNMLQKEKRACEKNQLMIEVLFGKKLKLVLFWATAKANTVNGERQLQALIDKKKVIITETSIRSDLHLEDAGGTDCLPTATIFEELARMGYEKPSQRLTFYKAFFSLQWKFLIHTITRCLSAKTTAWNEFSSTMAFAIICLATNQKFNFSKYIFNAMGRRIKDIDKDADVSLVDDTHRSWLRTRSRVQRKEEEPSEFKTLQASQPSKIKDKGKAIMIEPEVPLKRKDQVALDEDLARNLQLDAELIEEERLARKKEEEANIALIDKKGTEESFKGTEDELKSDKSKKAESSKEKAKGSRKKILDKKRAGKKQQQESSKRQRMEDDKETDEHEVVDEAELKKHLVIVKDDDLEIDAIPLATKPSVIIEYKLIREGIMAHYQLIRADGSSKRYSSMIKMLQGIDREDLQTLWKLVKIKHGDTRPEDEHERVLWGYLKVMFELDIKSDVWRSLQGYKVTIWMLLLLGLKRLQGFLELLLLSTAGIKVYAAGLQLLRRLTTAKRIKTV
ncbi:hypothetical protein Tco_0739626 [Tanacetum coccineum]